MCVCVWGGGGGGGGGGGRQSNTLDSKFHMENLG